MARNLTVIEITDTHLKCLQRDTQRENSLISFCLTHRLTGHSDSQIAEELRQEFLSRKVKADAITLIIPRRHVILKHLSFPTHSEAEIRKILALQISQHFPYSTENIVFDFTVLQKDPAGHTKILVFVVPKNIISRYLNLLARTGWRPQHITMSSLGLVSTYGLRKKIAGQEAEIFLDIDFDHSEICFYRGQLLFSRSIAQGNKDLTEDKVLALVEQVGLTLGAFNKEGLTDKISRIVISAHPLAESIRSNLEKYYQIPVEIHDVAKSFTFASPGPLSSAGEVSIAACLGALSRDFRNPINILPEEMVGAKRSHRQRSVVFKAIFLFILALLVVAQLSGGNVLSKGRYLEKLEKQMSQDKGTIERAEQQIRFLQLAKDETRSRILVADIIQKLYEILPPEVTLRTIDLNAAHVLALEGVADNSARVNQLQTNFSNSPLFKQATLQYATKRQKLEKEYVDFRIVCQIVLPSEADHAQ